MSMRDYAVDDYGLVLDGETIKFILSKLDVEPLDASSMCGKANPSWWPKARITGGF